MKNKYKQSFKDQAVLITLNSGRPYSEIALDLGINYQKFGNWMRKTMSSSNDHKVKGGRPNKQELRAAWKELALRKLEIGPLKKAAAYFAKEHP